MVYIAKKELLQSLVSDSSLSLVLHMADLFSDRMVKRFDLVLTAEQSDTYHLMAGDSGVSMGEIVRRAMTYIRKHQILDEILPEISGFTAKYQIH